MGGLLSGRRCSRFVRSWCCTVGALQALLYLVYDFAKSRTFAENIYNRRDGVLTNLAFTNFYASLREVCVGVRDHPMISKPCAILSRPCLRCCPYVPSVTCRYPGEYVSVLHRRGHCHWRESFVGL